MCRTGGRRCPSNHDAVARAARNARRRAAYAQARSTQGKDYTPRGPVSDSVVPTGVDSNNPSPTPRERVRRADGWLAGTTEEQFRIVGQRYDENLGVTITEHAGECVDLGLFAPVSVAGNPDWSGLDDESYRSFGFEQHSIEKNYIACPVLSIDNLAEYKAYQQEAKELINKRMSFSRNEVDYDNAGAIREWTSERYYDIQAFANGESSSSFVADVVTKIDEDIKSGAVGEQRITYCGVSMERVRLTEEDFVIGAELSFDGYQSTSLSKDVAGQFCISDDPAIFEISSPAGLNITGVSVSEEEQEVVLPRGCRYVVVGVHRTATYTGEAPVVQLVAVNSKGELLDGTNHDEPKPLEVDEDVESLEEHFKNDPDFNMDDFDF